MAKISFTRVNWLREKFLKGFALFVLTPSYFWVLGSSFLNFVRGEYVFGITGVVSAYMVSTVAMLCYVVGMTWERDTAETSSDESQPY
jgi:hypothetical protein